MKIKAVLLSGHLGKVAEAISPAKIKAVLLSGHLGKVAEAISPATSF